MKKPLKSTFLIMSTLIALICFTSPVIPATDRGPCDEAYYTNGLPDYTNGYLCDRHSQPSVVDSWMIDDVLIPDSIFLTGLAFWTVSPSNYQFEDRGDFIILSDDSGVPGAILVQAHNVPLTRTETGNTFFSLPEYIHTFEGLDIPLNAGSYWIGMRPTNGLDAGLSYHLAAPVTGQNAYFRYTANGFPSWTDSESAFGIPVGLAFCIFADPYDFTVPGLTPWQTAPATPFEYNRFDAEFVPGPEGEEWANCVYVLGGRTSAATESPDIYRYDPLTGTFSDTGVDMIEDVSNYTVNLILDDGTGNGPALYVMGGYNAESAATISLVQRFYPATGTIESLPSDPLPIVIGTEFVNASGTAVVDDVVYVFGGRAVLTTPYFTSETWSFNPNQPAGSRWSNLGIELSEGRASTMTAVQGTRIFCFGGDSAYDGSTLTATNSVEMLDIANLSAGWVSRSDLPFIIGEGQGFHVPYGPGIPASFLRKVAIAGGGQWPDQSSEALLGDLPTDIWNAGFPDLNEARRNHAGVFIPLTTDAPDDGLPGFWVFGGRTVSDDPPYGSPEYYSVPWIPTPTPSAAPTPTPSVCTELGCQIKMPSNLFNAGDLCSCTLTICNPSSTTYPQVPVFAILDVYGLYFFAPDFSNFNHYTLDITPGEQEVEVLPDFTWPENAGAASGILWYAAMTNADITDLFGVLGQFEFGWE